MSIQISNQGKITCCTKRSLRGTGKKNRSKKTFSVMYDESECAEGICTSVDYNYSCGHSTFTVTTPPSTVCRREGGRASAHPPQPVTRLQAVSESLFPIRSHKKCAPSKSLLGSMYKPLPGSADGLTGTVVTVADEHSDVLFNTRRTPYSICNGLQVENCVCLSSKHVGALR
jgi:hypothetical protein